MPTNFTAMTYYPDGKVPEITEIPCESLSERWLSVCSEILNGGPVYKRNMGSTLSHYEVQQAGPIGKLSVHNMACFEFAISLGLDSEQDRAAIANFKKLFNDACVIAGETPEDEAIKSFDEYKSKPIMMMFDYCNQDISDNDKLGIAQLGFHLANAYFDYCMKVEAHEYNS